ncbi:transposase [Spirosoma areae]
MSQKRTLLRQYKKQRTMLLNLQAAFAPLPIQDQTSQQSLQIMLTHLDKAIDQLSGEISQLCQTDFEQQFKRLTSIKGISSTIAWALIETTNGFQDFTSAKALAKYIGVVPLTYQSGKSGLHPGHLSNWRPSSARYVVHGCMVSDSLQHRLSGVLSTAQIRWQAAQSCLDSRV